MCYYFICKVINIVLNIINVIYVYFKFKLGTKGYYLLQLENLYINYENYRAHWYMNISI